MTTPVYKNGPGQCCCGCNGFNPANCNIGYTVTISGLTGNCANANVAVPVSWIGSPTNEWYGQYFPGFGNVTATIVCTGNVWIVTVAIFDVPDTGGGFINGTYTGQLANTECPSGTCTGVSGSASATSPTTTCGTPVITVA